MILVTGFGPYQEETNASGVLVNSLKGDLPNELLALENDLAFEVISCDDTSRETEHQSLESQLRDLLKQYEPELCIYTGQAPPYNKITIEKIATNSFMREIIDPERPVAYWSDLPGTENLKNAIEKALKKATATRNPIPSSGSILREFFIHTRRAETIF